MRRLVFLALAFALAAFWFFLPAETIRASDPRVKDGDTLILNGAAYRLDGIDAPEYRQSCTDAAGKVWTCGKEARSKLAGFAQGPLTCEVAGEDRYGRKLATCAGPQASDLGEAMVAAGFALSDGPYEKAQASARGVKRGIWAGQFQTPAEWRAANPRKDIE